jgi:outer membrane autotransporter protein
VPLIARQLTLFTLGTFHQRQGDQLLVQGSGPFTTGSVSLGGLAAPSTGSPKAGSAIWARTYGQTIEQHWTGLLSPEFSGGFVAGQIGVDVIDFESSSGHTDRAGVFYAHAEAQGDGRGFILAQHRTLAGTLSMSTNNVGAYWTHIGPSQWYVDAVLMGTFFDADPKSSRNIGAHMHGSAITASIEAGIPFRLLPYLTVEPQGQLIFNHMRFDPTADPFSRLTFQLDDSLVGRLGLRLEGETRMYGVRLQPFVLANLWYGFGGIDSTVFNDTVALATPFQGTSLELSGGVVARFADQVGIYARGSYSTNVGGSFRQTIGGQLGVRVNW